jgi:hypothetical protein
MSDIQTTHPSTKFSDKWLGPFTVMKVVRKAVYELKLPSSTPSCTQSFQW